MANARILPDLSKVSKEELIKALEAQGVSVGQSKEEKAFVGDYTPKKGKDAGKTVKRLYVQGNFYPLVIGQAACAVMAENADVIARFAKTGK